MVDLLLRVKDAWDSWSIKKKIILGIFVLLVMILICIIFFWSDEKNIAAKKNKKLEELLENKFNARINELNSKLKESQDRLESIVLEREELEKEQKDNEKKWDKITKDIGNSTSIDELRAMHEELLRNHK
jgi:peptidoglycan hydrolase CwlO-like protein